MLDEKDRCLTREGIKSFSGNNRKFERKKL